MARPSSTAATMVEKLSSASTISDADLATAVPDPIAIPISAFFRAGASFTPSPVCLYKQILLQALLFWNSWDQKNLLRFLKIQNLHYQITVFGSGLLTHSNISVMFETSYFKGIKKKKTTGCWKLSRTLACRQPFL